MPRGYVIMTEVIRDPAGMAAHGAVTYDSLVEHGAKMLVVDADYEVREGTWESGSRLAIMEFESPEVARHWYESEAGQEAHKLRRPPPTATCSSLQASFRKTLATSWRSIPRTGRLLRKGIGPARAKRGAWLPVGVAWWAGESWSSVAAKPTFSSRISPLATAELWPCFSPARGPMSSWSDRRRDLGQRHGCS